MPTHRDGGPPSAHGPSDPQKLRRFTLPRGSDERPLQFDGSVVAEAEAETSRALVLRAAIYRAQETDGT